MRSLAAACLAVLLLAARLEAAPEATSRIVLYGPETFTRTKKGPNSHTRTFTAPATAGRYFLTVANGDGSGGRLSSGTITLNGVEVFRPSDFHQEVVRLRREVTVLAANELGVEVSSNPGGFWTLDLEGEVPEVLLPPELRERAGLGSFFRQAFTGSMPATTETASFSVPETRGRFDLVLANGEGIERVTAARVRLNGVEVVRPSDLSATVDTLVVPVAVGGTNVLDVTILSGAGTRFELELVGFVPDATAPGLAILRPLPGACTGASDRVEAVYEDAVTGVDPAAFRARVEGVDVTALFAVGPDSATVRLGDLEPVLPQSTSVLLELEVSDRAAHRATASVRFTYDTVAPEAAVVQPPEGTITNDPTPDVVIAWSDATGGIEAVSAEVFMNGVDVRFAFALTATGATLVPNTTVALPDGPAIEIRASVADCSGNRAVASRTLLVDTVPPEITVVAPPQGALLADPFPPFEAAYSDGLSGVDVTGVRLLLDGGDLGTDATTTAGGVVFRPPAPLSDGAHTYTLEVPDRAANRTVVEQVFVVDATPPAPPTVGPVESPTAAASAVLRGRFALADAADIEILVDGGAEGVILVPPDRWQRTVALADGANRFEVAARDRAGNRSAPVLAEVVSDRTPPVLLPSPDPAQPLPSRSLGLEVRWSDPGDAPSGVDPGSFRALVGGLDRTALFTTGPEGATAALGGLAALLLGENRVVLSLADRVGNRASVGVTYTVATEPAVGIAFDFPAAAGPIPAASFHDLTVRLQRSDGSTDPEFTGVVRLSSTDARSLLDGLHIPYDLSDAGRVVLERLAVFATAGTHAIEGVVLGSPGLAGRVEGIQVVPGAPRRLVLVSGGEDRSLVVGTSPGTLVVRVEDAVGNGVPGVTVVVTEGASPGSTGRSGPTGEIAFGLAAPHEPGEVVVTVQADSLPAAGFRLVASELPVLSSLVDGSAVGDPRAEFAGVAPPGRPLTVLVDGASIGGVTAGSDGAYTLQPAADLADGPHTVVVVTDPGTQAERRSTPVVIVIDTTPPACPRLVFPIFEEVVVGSFATVRGVAEPGTEVDLFIDDAPAGRGVAAGGEVALETPPLSPGRHRVNLVATDRAGNRSGSSPTGELLVGPRPLVGRVLVGGPAHGSPVQTAAGVPVRLAGSGLSTVTTPTGVVFFPAVPAGRQVVEIAGSALGAHADLAVPVEVAREGVTGLPRPVFLSPLDARDRTALGIAPLSGELLAPVAATSGSFPGVALSLEAGSRVLLPEGAPSELSIARVPAGQIPLPFPEGVFSEFAYEIGPTGTWLPDGATLSLPAPPGAASGERFPLYQLVPHRGGWVVLGEAMVSTDGTQAVSAPLAVTGLHSIFFIPQAVTAKTTVRGRVELLDGAGGAVPFGDPRWGELSCFVLGRATKPDPATGGFEIADVPAVAEVVVLVKGVVDSLIVLTRSSPVSSVAGGTTDVGTVRLGIRLAQAHFVSGTTPSGGSTDGTHRLEAVVGEPAAGEMRGGGLVLRGGFVGAAFPAVGPPPAILSPLSGAVLLDDRPLVVGKTDPGQAVTLFDSGQEVATATSDARGLFRFEAASYTRGLFTGERVLGVRVGTGTPAALSAGVTVFVRLLDTDGDGLLDVDELRVHGTDPLRADTDGDGFADGAEFARGTNPRCHDVLLTSVLPIFGPEAGGTLVSITGVGFLANHAGPNTVSFGGVAATLVTVVSDSELSALTPSGAAGPVDVVVTNANGASRLPGGYAYGGAAPEAALLAGGMALAIGLTRGVQDACHGEVLVAVVDTGVDATHPDLAGVVLAGVDLTSPAGGDGRTDTRGHGTAMASLIAGQGVAGGVRGVAPAARILPVRLVGELPLVEHSLLAQGIREAADRRSRVIYVGFGSLVSSPELVEAVRYAQALGSLVVAPAGTNGGNHVLYPAAIDGVLAVGLSDPTGEPAMGANVEERLDLFAPAPLHAARSAGGYGPTGNASASAALAAGAAALVWANEPGLAPGEVRSRLMAHGEPVGVAGFAEVFPARLLSVDAAVNRTAPTSPPPAPPPGAGVPPAGVPPAGVPQAGVVRGRLQELPYDGTAVSVALGLENREATPQGLVIRSQLAGDPEVEERLTLAAGSTLTHTVSVPHAPAETGRRVLHIRVAVAVSGGEVETGHLRYRLHLASAQLAELQYQDVGNEPEVLTDAPWRRRPSAAVLPVSVFVPEIPWQWSSSPGDRKAADPSAELTLDRVTVAVLAGGPDEFRFQDGWRAGDDLPVGQVLYDVRGGASPGIIAGRDFTTEIEDENGDRLKPLPSPGPTETSGIAHAKLTAAGWHRILLFPRTSLALHTDGHYYLVTQVTSPELYVYEKRHRDPFTGGGYVRRFFDFRKVLRVANGTAELPQFADTPTARDYDAHFHTMSEYTNDLGLLAPRKAYGGPLRMVDWCAFSVGMIDTIDRNAIRSGGLIVSTDHNVFLTDRDMPEVGPYVRDNPATGKPWTPAEEYGVLRGFFGTETAAQELTLRGPFTGTNAQELLVGLSLGHHALVYEHPVAFPGPWHGGRLGTGLFLPFSLYYPFFPDNPNVLTQEGLGPRDAVGTLEVLDRIQTGGPGAMFAAHPYVEGFLWDKDEERRATRLPPFKTEAHGVRRLATAGTGPAGFIFKGHQFWNEEILHQEIGLTGHQFRRLNPFVARGRYPGSSTHPSENVYRGGWESVPAPYAPFEDGLARWATLVREGLDYAFDERPEEHFIRKLYLLAGTDAHGDFNYATAVTATHLSRLPLPENGYTDNAFGRLRTHVLEGGRRGFDRGQAVVTNGPLADFSIDAELRFLSDPLVWVDTQTDPKAASDPDGRMGGAGDFDGGRTLLYEVSGLPVVRHRWKNTADFGGAVETTTLFGIEAGPTPGWPGVQRLSPGTDGELGAELFALRSAGTNAVYLGAFTAPSPMTFVAGHPFALTNPLWTSPVVLDPVVPDREFLGVPSPLCTGFTTLEVAKGALRLKARFQIDIAMVDPLVWVRQLDRDGVSNGGFVRLEVVSWDPDGQGFTAANPGAVSFPATPDWQYPPPRCKFRFVFIVAEPRDVHGNQLNPVAKTYTVSVG
ncbi:MAG: S8 family serine peptidase [Planctomycetes bacterium]|nr:S8 family serine peptidase [Planctomycetota bacterium]